MRLRHIAGAAFMALSAPNLAQPQCWSMLGGRAALTDELVRSAVSADRKNVEEAFLLDETDSLNAKMGLSAKLLMVPVANAFANPEDMNVYFGRPLIKALKTLLTERLKTNPDLKDYQGSLRAGLRFVLAHEFGHLYQFATWKHGIAQNPGSSPPLEVQADCLAGMWMGFDLARQRADVNMVRIALETAYVVGDEQWTNPLHHGAPRTRWLCAAAGAREGQSQAFGPRDSTYSTRRQQIYDWSASTALRILQRDTNQRTF